MDSYAQKRYEQDKQSTSRICAGFAMAMAILWPVSYVISGHAPTVEASWWNATTVVAWLAATVCSAGFGISAAILQFIVPPVEGSNH